MHFTDEAHFDPDAMIREYVIRSVETVELNENTQEMSSKHIANRALHMIAFVSWFHRKSEMIFYNDEKEIIPDVIIKKARSRKLKQRKNETNDEYEARLTK